ncbi:OapC/ArvC family zinc-ribbon domain-containing protein, partial [Halolamina litorea]
MPHECTNCGRTFENGSKQMLSGCPDCGGNKFQFQPAGKASAADAADSTADPAEPADQTPTADPAPAVDADDAATADTERELSELIQDDDPASVADAGAGTDRAADDSVPVEFDDEFEDAQIDDE